MNHGKIARGLYLSIVILAASFSLAAQTTDARATPFQLGERVVTIPNPDGFEEAASQFESIKKQMTATEDPGNDMLAVHLPKEDCEKLRRGEFGAHDFYTKISIRKANRTRDETVSDFSALVSEFRKSGADVLDINSPRMKATVEHLDKSLSELNKSDTNLEMSQPVNLGEFDTRPNVYSVLLLLTYKYDENGVRKTKPIIGGLTFLRVNQRLIYVFTYRNYAAKTDFEVLQSFTKTWVGKILAAN